MSKEFYIGWKNEMPTGSKKGIKLLMGGLFIILFALAIITSKHQRPFNNFVFELGRQTEVTGTLYTSPVPLLVADEGILPEGLSPSILLIGYGKFGAEGILNAISTEEEKLQNKKVTLKGTLIYGDGRTLLELTNKEKSLLNIESGVVEVNVRSEPEISERLIHLRGEIVDPKCYFGVMKPGEGKVHKSCAIRCISGGIPPVLRHETGSLEHPYEYYILLGTDGGKINHSILPYVAEVVGVNAEISEFENWKIAQIDVGDIMVD